MSEKILVPVLGESITEATVSKWLKNEGDTVEADEPIVELETDKVNLEVPSPISGTLTEINSKDGSIVEVGALLGSVSENGLALKKTEERTFFHQWVISTLEIMIMKNLYSEETGHQESQHLKEYLGSSPGVRHAYRNSTIRQQLDLDSVTIIDEIVREIDEEVGLDGILETESSYPYKK